MAASIETQELGAIIETVLHEIFNGLALDVVKIERDTDEFGDGILRVRVVFDSHGDVLDPPKTASVVRHLRPRMAELGEDAFPVMFYIAKSELKRDSELGKVNLDDP